MDEQYLSSLLENAVADLGLEIDDVELLAAGKHKVLKVVVDGDGPRGTGPTMDEIADATRAISAALDESGADGEKPYTLEVSSRGVSRPLSRPAHYRRNKNRLVKITLSDETLLGRIKSSDDESVAVDVDGSLRTLAFVDIKKALIQVEMKPFVEEEAE